MNLLRKWTETSLVLRILIGLVIGAVLGLTVPGWKGIGILGTVFVSALKAVAPVLVAVLVMASIAKANGGLGPRFRTVLTLYLVSTLGAALLAVAGSTLFPVTLHLQDVIRLAAASTPNDKHVPKPVLVELKHATLAICAHSYCDAQAEIAQFACPFAIHLVVHKNLHLFGILQACFAIRLSRNA